MKLKKIIGYVKVDGQQGVRTTIIPSGFKGGYIEVMEDSTYNLEVGYDQSSELFQLLEALKKVERKWEICLIQYCVGSVISLELDKAILTSIS